MVKSGRSQPVKRPSLPNNEVEKNFSTSDFRTSDKVNTVPEQIRVVQELRSSLDKRHSKQVMR